MRVLVIALILSSSVARAETPAQIASKLVKAQVEALGHHDAAAFAATFAPDAVVLGPFASEVATEGLQQVLSGIPGSGMHTKIVSAKQASLTAGGTDKVIWIAAELALEAGGTEYTSPGPDFKLALRITELATVTGGKWKIVAATLGIPGRDTDFAGGPIPSTDRPDVLSRIAITPTSIRNALANDAVVFGTEPVERAIGGPAATKLVDSWKGLKLAIEGNVREVRNATYGYVQANVTWTDAKKATRRMHVMMIATPDPKGTWTIHLVHFAWQ